MRNAKLTVTFSCIRFRLTGEMDEYQHALYFEAGDLTEREQEKIRRHFQIKRNSGGGDCGMIEKTGHKTYKICFKEKDGKKI